VDPNRARRWPDRPEGANRPDRPLQRALRREAEGQHQARPEHAEPDQPGPGRAQVLLQEASEGGPGRAPRPAEEMKRQQKPSGENEQARDQGAMGTRGLFEAPDQEPRPAGRHPEGEDEDPSAEESDQHVHHRLRTQAQQAEAQEDPPQEKDQAQQVQLLIQGEGERPCGPERTDRRRLAGAPGLLPGLPAGLGASSFGSGLLPEACQNAIPLSDPESVSGHPPVSGRSSSMSPFSPIWAHTTRKAGDPATYCQIPGMGVPHR
jgi:hypothetical protein